MRMLLHFGLIGSAVALAAALVCVFLYAVGRIIWEGARMMVDAGDGWILWSGLVIAAVGFVGGVLFPFVVPAPKES